MNNDSISDKLIIVVKDTTKDLSELLNTLQLAEYIVLVVQDEKDSLTLAASARPNFIVVDVLMSEMKGWEICTSLKNNPATSPIPLVLINSSADIAEKVAALGWKNVECIADANELEKVIHLIKTYSLLQARRSQDLLVKATSITNCTTNKDLILANNQLEAANRQLLDENRDLEKFAFIVAHDLQAPLRSLTMFTELLVNEYQDDLDEGAKKYLERICSNGFRMQTLIEDLLAYARAGKSEQTWVMVDLNQVLHQVTENLHSAIAKTQAQIVVGNLPQILINPTEIIQLFQNLVENAIKFCEEQPPQIKVTASNQGQEWLIAIADNGIGIEAEFQSQIFHVFQRLHPDDTYSGTGMGLAICQKIVERYGGRIWVESTIEKGSTFYFTLPIDADSQ